ncbi:MAG: endonuclease domain-containing protein, partial [Nitrospiraceae bacterium]
MGVKKKSRSPTQFARQLRKNLTDAEQRLWRHLRLRQANGQKIRRQQPIGPYIADFVCFERTLIVEVDGGQHADSQCDDSNRTAWLEAQGFHVLRFW